MTLELVPWNKTSSERVTENGLNCLSPWVCSPRPAMSGDLAVQCSKLIEWYHRSDFCFPNEFVLPLVYIYIPILLYWYYLSFVLPMLPPLRIPMIYTGRLTADARLLARRVIPEADFIIKSVVLAAKLPKKIQRGWHFNLANISLKF